MTLSLNKLKNLNDNLIHFAQQQEWEQLEINMTSRHELVIDLTKNESLDRTELKLIQDSVQKADNQIKDIIQQSKNSDIESSLNLRQAHHAISQYHRNS